MEYVHIIINSISNRVINKETFPDPNSTTSFYCFTGTSYRKRGGPPGQAAFIEASYIITQQVQNRLENKKYPRIEYQSQFKEIKNRWTSNYIDILCEEYPMLEKASLKSELELL